jgi:hypothetical protein
VFARAKASLRRTSAWPTSTTLWVYGLDPTEYAPLLAPLVDVLLPEDRAAKHAPEEIRRRQLAGMTAWILASVRTQAVVLTFEDLD